RRRVALRRAPRRPRAACRSSHPQGVRAAARSPRLRRAARALAGLCPSPGVARRGRRVGAGHRPHPLPPPVGRGALHALPSRLPDAPPSPARGPPPVPLPVPAHPLLGLPLEGPDPGGRRGAVVAAAGRRPPPRPPPGGAGALHALPSVLPDPPPAPAKGPPPGPLPVPAPRTPHGLTRR